MCLCVPLGRGPSSWQHVHHQSAMVRVCWPALQVPALVASYPGPPAADGSPQVSSGRVVCLLWCRLLCPHMAVGRPCGLQKPCR
jgi:hypothetical protein